MTFGETKEEVIQQIKELIPGYLRKEIKVEDLFHDPSFTGFVYPVDKYFPAWETDEDSPIVRAGQATRKSIGLPDAASGKWNFSTNGIYWAGKARIPSIVFGPGDEEFGHTSLEQVPLDEVVKAIEFYALFPLMLKEQTG